ncbi:ankyrin repeat-containing protein BDA1-like [Rhododendron vialii]|uniref:ankyrin repeat-containing protein BDA1-like n=1 Tax=Rhododendron vialii TaxID=182163 RepID=UPI00265DF140|nr:ankyrin repeat-containing protein BDA1-like [Rhododendron vialii]
MTEEMERRLSEAAMKGSVESLINLLQHDPLIIDKAIASCISQSPLHLSSLLGHLDFTTELLTRKPEFAAELDSEGSSPLHLAAAKGHLEIVKRLLLAAPEMGMVRNSDGRTPLHVAAMKGRVEVVAELVRVVPESTRMVTDRGETGLHLSVRHNRVEALRVLVEVMRRDGELVNWRDCDGNTILHIAVAKKHIEIIKFLLTNGSVEVNALNRNGSTSLDILKQSPRDLRDSEIEDSLRHAGGLSAKDLHLITDEWVPTKGPQIAKRLSSHQKSSKKPIPKHKHTDWLGRKRSALMVVASLIATVAFQAGLTPPGGVWQDDYQLDSNGNPVDDPHTVGTAVMAYKDHIQYSLFMIFNTIAFLASLSIILLLVSGLPLKRRRWMWVQMVIMWISITAQVLTYFLALRNMSPKSVSAQSMLREVTEISVLTWLCLMMVVFIGNIVRMNLWILRKYGYIKEKERKQEDIDDEGEGEEE